MILLKVIIQILEVKKRNFPSHFNFESTTGNDFFLFIFVVKFQGYIIESQILSVVLNKEGNELENLESIVFDIENYDKIFQFPQSEKT